MGWTEATLKDALLLAAFSQVSDLKYYNSWPSVLEAPLLLSALRIRGIRTCNRGLWC
jgi:hypothetical protein